MFRLFIAAVLSLFLFACNKGENPKQFTTLADFEGTKIGSQNGAVFGSFVNKVIPNVQNQYFNTYNDIVDALITDKVDAICLDMPVAKYIVVSDTNLVIFPDLVADDRYGFAVRKDDTLGIKASEALKKLKEDGTINELERTWFSTDESKKLLPIFEKNENTPTIKFACNVSVMPMCYIGTDGKPTGFDLDIMSRIAKEMNMNVEFIAMNFEALLPALLAGKVSMSGGSMSITEERLQSVDFVGPYYEGGAVLIIKKERLGK